MVGPKCLLHGPMKMFSPKNGEKTEEKKWGCLMEKNALVYLHMGIVRTLLFFTFFFLDVASFLSFFFFGKPCKYYTTKAPQVYYKNGQIYH